MLHSLSIGLLPLVLFLGTANLVRGSDQHTWVGRQVMAKSARSQPRSGGRPSSKTIICVRTVERTKGDWLLVGDGWLRGVARFHLHQYQGALADLNVALRANPARAVAYDIRGACKEELGQVAEAMRDFDKAIELDPQSVSARSHRDHLRMARAGVN